jgi:predicted DsbA family dithiol-disulfide isomerase
MSESLHSYPPLFSQVDVTSAARPQRVLQPHEDQRVLLQELLAAQDRTNALLEEMVGHLTMIQRQRNAELNEWKNANPKLAKRCREAAKTLNKVQAEFLERITEEVADSQDDFEYGEFMLNEFIDRNGPRLAHLNSVIQVLGHLGSGAQGSDDEAVS